MGNQSMGRPVTLPTAAEMIATSRWQRSSSSDRRALDVVDGRGAFEGLGPHYSRRTRDSKTFTGAGRGSFGPDAGARCGPASTSGRLPRRAPGRAVVGQASNREPRYLWRNMMFRSVGAGLSWT